MQTSNYKTWVNAEESIIQRNTHNGVPDYQAIRSDLADAGYQRSDMAIYLRVFRTRIKSLK